MAHRKPKKIIVDDEESNWVTDTDEEWAPDFSSFTPPNYDRFTGKLPGQFFRQVSYDDRYSYFKKDFGYVTGKGKKDRKNKAVQPPQDEVDSSKDTTSDNSIDFRWSEEDVQTPTVSRGYKRTHKAPEYELDQRSLIDGRRGILRSVTIPYESSTSSEEDDSDKALFSTRRRIVKKPKRLHPKSSAFLLAGRATTQLRPATVSVKPKFQFSKLILDETSAGEFTEIESQIQLQNMTHAEKVEAVTKKLDYYLELASEKRKTEKIEKDRKARLDQEPSVIHRHALKTVKYTYWQDVENRRKQKSVKVCKSTEDKKKFAQHADFTTATGNELAEKTTNVGVKYGVFSGSIKAPPYAKKFPPGFRVAEQPKHQPLAGYTKKPGPDKKSSRNTNMPTAARANRVGQNPGETVASLSNSKNKKYFNSKQRPPQKALPSSLLRTTFPQNIGKYIEKPFSNQKNQKTSKDPEVKGAQKASKVEYAKRGAGLNSKYRHDSLPAEDSEKKEPTASCQGVQCLTSDGKHLVTKDKRSNSLLRQKEMDDRRMKPLSKKTMVHKAVQAGEYGTVLRGSRSRKSKNAKTNKPEVKTHVFQKQGSSSLSRPQGQHHPRKPQPSKIPDNRMNVQHYRSPAEYLKSGYENRKLKSVEMEDYTHASDNDEPDYDNNPTTSSRNVYNVFHAQDNVQPFFDNNAYKSKDSNNNESGKDLGTEDHNSPIDFTMSESENHTSKYDRNDTPVSSVPLDASESSSTSCFDSEAIRSGGEESFIEEWPCSKSSSVVSLESVMKYDGDSDNEISTHDMQPAKRYGNPNPSVKLRRESLDIKEDRGRRGYGSCHTPSLPDKVFYFPKLAGRKKRDDKFPHIKPRYLQPKKVFYPRPLTPRLNTNHAKLQRKMIRYEMDIKAMKSLIEEFKRSAAARVRVKKIKKRRPATVVKPGSAKIFARTYGTAAARGARGRRQKNNKHGELPHIDPYRRPAWDDSTAYQPPEESVYCHYDFLNY